MLRIDPNDDQTVYVTGVTLASTNDGGKTWKSVDWPPDGVFRTAFGDVRTLWIDPRDSQRILFGSDGGVYVSYDRGETCHLWYNIPLGELYTVSVDMEDPYNIYVGLQDHDSWKGPSTGWAGSITLSDWVTVGGGDGMYNQVHPKDGRWLYNNREFGAMWRLDQKTGRPDADHAAARDGETRRAVQLDAAHSSFSPRSGRRLCRRPDRLPVGRPGRHLGGDQPRPDDRRCLETGWRGPYFLLHDHDACGVAGRARRYLGGRGRRQGPGHAGRRRILARCNGRNRRRGRTRAALGKPRFRLSACGRHGLRRQNRLARERRDPLSLQDRRLRGNLDFTERRSS
jgi:hypothetical protein